MDLSDLTWFDDPAALAVSDEINAEQLLADAQEALRELTGELPVAPEILQPEIPLLKPEPADQGEEGEGPGTMAGLEPLVDGDEGRFVEGESGGRPHQ